MYEAENKIDHCVYYGDDHPDRSECYDHMAFEYVPDEFH